MPQQYHADQFGQSREVSIQVSRSRSGLASWALRCALPFFVPVLPLLGMLMGWMALGAIGRNVAKTGRRRARLAVLIGFIFTAAQAAAGWMGWQYYAAMQRGPHGALVAGLGGDTAGFASSFEDPIASTAQAGAFLALLRDRYGSCENATLVLADGWYKSWRPFDPFDYQLRFSEATVRARVQIVLRPDLTTWNWRPRLRSIELNDPDHGVVRFPTAARTTVVASAGAE